ncbi:24077_t:CDS:1, partial [Racocetra persica]
DSQRSTNLLPVTGPGANSTEVRINLPPVTGPSERINDPNKVSLANFHYDVL